MNMYVALEEVLSRLAQEIDPSDPPYWEYGSENLIKLEKTWTQYLASIGVERVPHETQTSMAGFTSVTDPLYTGTFLKIPLDVYTRIKVLGLP
jgi:hypothetical protein